MSEAGTFKLKPEIKQKWVEALRSGKYMQGTERMAYEAGDGQMSYCCLGVLGKLFCDDIGKDFEEYLDISDNEVPAMTPEFQEWSGLSVTESMISKAQNAYLHTSEEGVSVNGSGKISYTPNLLIGGQGIRAASFNDGGATFDEIAAAIETQL